MTVSSFCAMKGGAAMRCQSLHRHARLAAMKRRKLMRRTLYQALALALLAPAAFAAGPSQSQLAESVELGGLAALAPMCGLRDEAWSADLRRSTIQGATGTTAHDDGSLKAAPGSNLVVGALSYAETEALEDFAESPPDATCGPLAKSPVLTRADEMVRQFRAQTPGS
jgi:hypothetical protein